MPQHRIMTQEFVHINRKAVIFDSGLPIVGGGVGGEDGEDGGEGGGVDGGGGDGCGGE